MSSNFENVAVVKKANVYFDGKCVSHTFNTGAAEIMETVAGACRYKLAGADWVLVAAGESFNVPANSAFDIEVTGEPYHYVCHFA